MFEKLTGKSLEMAIKNGAKVESKVKVKGRIKQNQAESSRKKAESSSNKQ